MQRQRSWLKRSSFVFVWVNLKEYSGSGRIATESARVGMILDKDILSAKNVKLAVRGIELTEKMIQVLRKNEIRIMDISESDSIGF
jgi:hypothetical protein